MAPMDYHLETTQETQEGETKTKTGEGSRSCCRSGDPPPAPQR